MPSLLPDYEYDIFISYRHKDNREYWVTDFVNALKNELAATSKEEISIYFDFNAIDGLLESHHVDKSLGNKLKCVLFIPILSRTYCDPKSFAWQHEFCAFNKMASADTFGRDIKLRNGNVASRILPITIHELDPDDIERIEQELASRIRSIDFVFRSAGVNRPLQKDDSPEGNAKRLTFRDQINKVANAANEIITSLQHPEKALAAGKRSIHEELAYGGAREAPPADKDQRLKHKSIAVLPFVSLAPDSSQEYFSDGVTENILIELASIKNLRVISRTSVMRYKKTVKLATEIADELGVKYLLEGSVQMHGNKVKINVQLIDAEEDENVWTKVFVENLDDIFTIQNHVAEAVVGEFQSSFKPEKTLSSVEIPTRNLEAYDLFLRGRHAFNQWSVDGYRTATDYFKQALELDPDFKQAYSYLASSYSARMSWNGDLSPTEAIKYINHYLAEAWKRGPSDNDYLTKAFVEFFINKDFKATEKLLQSAMELSPNNSAVLYAYGYLLSITGRFSESLNIIEKAKKTEPHSVAYYNYKGICFYLMGETAQAITLFKEGLKLFPQVLRFYDHLGKAYLMTGGFKDALMILKTGLQLSVLRPPSMLAYLVCAHTGLHETHQAEELIKELADRSERNEKGVNYYLALASLAAGNNTLAQAWFRKAEETNDVDLIWKKIDPLMQKLNHHGDQGSPSNADFEGAINFIIKKQEEELPKELVYHNLDHIRDVVESAIKIAENEKTDKNDIDLIKVAAWFHDAGFTVSQKEHEKVGCGIAREVLPGFGFSAGEIERICGMIMATRIPQTPQNHLEQIVCDADLDYLGRDDFYSIGSRLFEEMKLRGFLETEREWNLIQKTFLENHRYHTAYSKQHREASKQKHLEEVIATLHR